MYVGKHGCIFIHTYHSINFMKVYGLSVVVVGVETVKKVSMRSSPLRVVDIAKRVSKKVSMRSSPIRVTRTLCVG